MFVCIFLYHVINSIIFFSRNEPYTLAIFLASALVCLDCFVYICHRNQVKFIQIQTIQVFTSIFSFFLSLTLFLSRLFFFSPSSFVFFFTQKYCFPTKIPNEIGMVLVFEFYRMQKTRFRLLIYIEYLLE